MFKVGEKVIHHRYGEGVLMKNYLSSREEFPLFFDSNGGWSCVLTNDGKHDKDDLYPSIFYKPQTFDMSKPEPEIGTWGYFWDKDDEDYCVFAMLLEINMEIRLKYFVSRKTRYECYSTDIPPHIKELMNGNNKPNP